jgi:DNA-binding beta-propeller fold protein YncE
MLMPKTLRMSIASLPLLTWAMSFQIPFHTRDNRVVNSIQITETAVGPIGVVIAPDGKRGYVSVGESGTVVVFDTERMKAIKSPWG